MPQPRPITGDVAQGTEPAITRTWNEFRQEADKTTFHVEGAPLEEDHQLILYRTEAKRSGNSFGQRKAVLKTTRLVEVATIDGGTEMRPVIVTVNFSAPEALTDAQADQARWELNALTTGATGVAEKLFKDLAI